MSIVLAIPHPSPLFLILIDRQRGGIAQLGEREHGMFEVAGSIPVTSTIFLVNFGHQNLKPSIVHLKTTGGWSFSDLQIVLCISRHFGIWLFRGL